MALGLATADATLMPRRAAAAAATVGPAQFVATSRSEWQIFKQRFLAPDGRVIDTGNGGVSHTEGQGWGLLFSVAFDDPRSFDLILGWTTARLRRGDDALHAWRYEPCAVVPVRDWNNATDGDLFIACALGRAARRWGRPDYASAAGEIAGDMLRLLVRDIGPHTVLLPGVQGFESAAGVTVNPSYYAFPMLAELAEVAPSPLWARLVADGLALIEAGRFGQWHLPPDWLLAGADGSLVPHPHWPPRFSYDAIRVPLYLVWSRLAEPSVQQAFVNFWAAGTGSPPAWVDLVTNARADYRAPPGMVAVARTATSLPRLGEKVSFPSDFPQLRASPDYYSAALILLSRLAWQENLIK
jgi:endoglucanase